MYCLLYLLLNKEDLWLVAELPLNELKDHLKNMHERKYFGENDQYWIVERNYDKGVYFNTFNNYDMKRSNRIFSKNILKDLKIVHVNKR